MITLRDLDLVADQIEDADRDRVEAFHHAEMTGDDTAYEHACRAYEELVARSYVDYGPFWPQVRDDLRRAQIEAEESRYGEPPDEEVE